MPPTAPSTLLELLPTPSPFASTTIHRPAAVVAMVLDGGIHPHRRRDCRRRMFPEARGYPGMAATGGDQELP